MHRHIAHGIMMCKSGTVKDALMVNVSMIASSWVTPLIASTGEAGFGLVLKGMKGQSVVFHVRILS
jgi:hypothetical protein